MTLEAFNMYNITSKKKINVKSNEPEDEIEDEELEEDLPHTNLNFGDLSDVGINPIKAVILDDAQPL